MTNERLTDFIIENTRIKGDPRYDGLGVSYWYWKKIFIHWRWGEQTKRRKYKWKVKLFLIVLIAFLGYVTGEHEVFVQEIQHLPPEAKEELSNLKQRYQIIGEFASIDFNRDGVMDFVGVSSKGMIFGFDGKSKDRLWEWSPTNYGIIGDAKPLCRAFPTVADLTNDGKDDVVVVFEKKGILVLKGQTIFDQLTPNTGLTSDAWRDLSDIVGKPVVSDFTGDGILDVTVRMKQEVQVYQWNATLSQPRLTHKGTYPSLLASKKLDLNALPPVVGDVDGDGDAEIVVIYDDGEVVLFEFEPHQEKKIGNLPKADYVDATLADLNTDGALDVCLVAESGMLVAFDIKRARRLFQEEIQNQISFEEGQQPTSLGVGKGGRKNHILVIGMTNGGVMEVKLSAKRKWFFGASPTTLGFLAVLVMLSGAVVSIYLENLGVMG